MDAHDRGTALTSQGGERREAIILAGGLGTRLRPLVADRPKPLADINGRPFLAYLLDYLATHGYGRVILAVGYLARQVRQHFGDRYRALELTYSVETEPLGTGGAIREGLRLSGSSQVTVLNGDSYFPVDLGNMAEFHARGGHDLTLALRRLDDCSRYGTVTVDGEQVAGFAPGGEPSPGYVNGGVYILQRALLETFPAQGGFSLENDFLPVQVTRLRVGAFVSDAYFIDIGIPDDYLRARAEFAGRKEQSA